MNAFHHKNNRLIVVFSRIGQCCLLLLVVVACNPRKQLEKQVFITDTGTKFHLEHCRYLKFSQKAISLKSATENGFSACKVCKPTNDKEHQPDQSKVKQATPSHLPKKPLQYSIRCSGRNVNGIQCKRMTKNPGGKCWQHQD